MARYRAEPPDEWELGSGGTVLRNLRGITDPREAESVETYLLTLAQARSLGRVHPETPITVRLIRDLHRSWLRSLYPFAGEVRRVDLSKGYVRFAPAAYLETTLAELDRVLDEETPCEGMDEPRLVRAIARVHTEHVLAHPFREGNGRTARWVADLMALQAGKPTLRWHFQHDTEARREQYFAALGQGFAGDLSPLEALVREALTSDPR